MVIVIKGSKLINLTWQVTNPLSNYSNIYFGEIFHYLLKMLRIKTNDKFRICVIPCNWWNKLKFIPKWKWLSNQDCNLFQPVFSSNKFIFLFLIVKFSINRNNEKRKEKSRDAARCRRSRETEIFTELGETLPVRKDELENLDKSSVMRLAIATLKIEDMLQLCESRSD